MRLKKKLPPVWAGAGGWQTPPPSVTSSLRPIRSIPVQAACRSTQRSTHACLGMHMQQCSAVPLKYTIQGGGGGSHCPSAPRSPELLKLCALSLELGGIDAVCGARGEHTHSRTAGAWKVASSGVGDSSRTCPAHQAATAAADKAALSVRWMRSSEHVRLPLRRRLRQGRWFGLLAGQCR